MRAEVGFNYNNENVKDYLVLTRNIIKQVISHKNSLQNLLRKKYESIDSEYLDRINNDTKIIESINEILRQELSFRYLYDVNPPMNTALIINETTIGKTQCLADTGIFILTFKNFSPQFRIDLIEHTNISGFLSDQPAENLYVNENKISIYIKEYFKNYKSINNSCLPALEADFLMQIYDVHVNINEYIRSNLARKMLFEKNLSLFEYSEDRFYDFISEENITEHLKDLNKLKKEIQDFFPLEHFIE